MFSSVYAMLHEGSANAILLIVSRVAWWLLALVLSLLIGLAYSCTAYGYVVFGGCRRQFFAV